MQEIYKIAQNVYERKQKLHVYTYKLGKEEIMVKLAEKYDTKCVVSKERYKWICLADYYPNRFTDT